MRWIAAICLTGGLGAQSLTTVTDTITWANGVMPNGYATIRWQRFLNASKQVVAPNSVGLVVPVTSGAFSVLLTPTDTAVPVGSCYSVAYSLNGTNYTRTWNVPTTTNQVGLSVVESDTPCTPQTAAAVALSQLTNSGAKTGQVIAWNGAYWAPALGSGNYVGTETGTNNAWAIALTDASGNAVSLVAGLEVCVQSTHTLQAGANTLSFNGTAKNIKSHLNSGNNIATAHSGPGIGCFMYDGTGWEDLSE